MRQIFTLLIGAASVYFFYDQNFFVAVLLLLWMISLLFGVSLQRLAQGVGTFTNQAESDRKANITLQFKVNIAEVLQHKIVTNLYKKLKEMKAVSFESESKWRDHLIDNFKKKFPKATDHTADGVRYVWTSVKFNIKNNLLWKDDQIDFGDSVYHEWYIPYIYKEGEDDVWTSSITAGITLRLFIVNGILKLQVGDFSKETSPEILRDGLAIYKRHATIASFPIMYMTQDIPRSYLNMTMYATDSYWKWHKDTEGKAKDMTKDWKELCKDFDDYSHINSIDDEIPDQNKFTAIVKRFQEKSEPWLEKEGFKNPFARDDDDYYTPPWMRDDSISYWNEFLQVYIANIKELREKREQYSYPDYWEESPL